MIFEIAIPPGSAFVDGIAVIATATGRMLVTGQRSSGSTTLSSSFATRRSGACLPGPGVGIHPWIGAGSEYSGIYVEDNAGV